MKTLIFKTKAIAETHGLTKYGLMRESQKRHDKPLAYPTISRHWDGVPEGEWLSHSAIERICDILQCTPGDLMGLVSDGDGDNPNGGRDTAESPLDLVGEQSPTDLDNGDGV